VAPGQKLSLSRRKPEKTYNAGRKNGNLQQSAKETGWKYLKQGVFQRA
jgi:hypothetical protein